jgi:hypothetical protein
MFNVNRLDSQVLPFNSIYEEAYMKWRAKKSVTKTVFCELCGREMSIDAVEEAFDDKGMLIGHVCLDQDTCGNIAYGEDLDTLNSLDA